jgi:UDP-N-acetylmuramoyl-L-alanyl-D-glutamate--2,6-diaminopimelate ligase
MAKLACEYSDKVILTSDNPRTENPMDILNDMLAGLDSSQKRKCEVIENRKDAIKKASEFAQKNDIVLVAGKGHETYQEINGVKYPFDDREILKSVI